MESAMSRKRGCSAAEVSIPTLALRIGLMRMLTVAAGKSLYQKELGNKLCRIRHV
jgi:hypothetical protein